MLNGLTWAPQTTKVRGGTRLTNAHAALLRFLAETPAAAPTPTMGPSHCRARLRSSLLNSRRRTPTCWALLGHLRHPLARGAHGPQWRWATPPHGGAHLPRRGPYETVPVSRFQPVAAALRLSFLLVSSPTGAGLTPRHVRRRWVVVGRGALVRGAFRQA